MIRLIKHRKQNDSYTGPEPSFITKAFASTLFTGYVPAASGTLSSAFAAALYFFLPGFDTLSTFIILILTVLVLGIIASASMERRYGHDPSEVTIDEVVGMWISLLLLPKSVFITIGSFFVFRFFDIIKPFPAKKFDAMHGGFGIMMDDVVAGVYANITMKFILLIPVIRELFLRY